MRPRDRALGSLWLVASLLVAAPAAAQSADDTALPAGHPSVAPGTGGAPGAGGENPHGNAATGMFEPPPDTSEEDGSLPAGTIVVDLRDADNRALTHTNFTLGIIHNTVAKGESREHRAIDTDDNGRGRFDGLPTGSGVAYRVSVPRDGASFAAMPFQLPQGKGMHVTLHVYPVTRDIQSARVVMQAVVFAEVKDDRVQLEEGLTVYNFGKVAWLPDGLLMTLPETFTALNAQQSMSDQGVDAVDKVGARLHGTFAPGRNDVEFRWQLPYDGEREINVDVGLPPHVAVLRVIAAASQDMKLVVEGLPDAVRRTDAQGQRMLVTEKQMKREDPPLTALRFALRDLPTAGPGRFVAVGLAGLGVAVGLAFALSTGRTTRPKAGKAARARLLAELEDLERARRQGDVGPKTYERARRAIVDALARTLAASGEDAPAT